MSRGVLGIQSVESMQKEIREVTLFLHISLREDSAEEIPLENMEVRSFSAFSVGGGGGDES